MSSNGFWQAVDLMILLVGVYGLYAAWVLKNKGKIIKLFLKFFLFFELKIFARICK